MEALQWRTRSLTESISIWMSSAEKTNKTKSNCNAAVWTQHTCAFQRHSVATAARGVVAALVSPEKKKIVYAQVLRRKKFKTFPQRTGLAINQAGINSRHFTRSWRMTAFGWKHTRRVTKACDFSFTQFWLPSLFHNRHPTFEKWKENVKTFGSFAPKIFRWSVLIVTVPLLARKRVLERKKQERRRE